MPRKFDGTVMTLIAELSLEIAFKVDNLQNFL